VRGVKEEVERGIDKIITLPLDGEHLAGGQHSR
jgi:hypothetical protein